MDVRVHSRPGPTVDVRVHSRPGPTVDVRVHSRPAPTVDVGSTAGPVQLWMSGSTAGPVQLWMSGSTVGPGHPQSAWVASWPRTHRKARAEAFNPQLLRSGWVAAGLYLWNPSQIYVTKRPRSDSHGDSNIIFPTPKHLQDVYRSIEQLGSNLNREQWTVLQKASKAASPDRHRWRNREKRKVAVDPNSPSENIETIKQSMMGQRRQRLAKGKKAEALRAFRAPEQAKM